MVEPLAVGMHAATKAAIRPGDLAIVLGAGPIGWVTALSALAAGCARVVLTDVAQPKLDRVAQLDPTIARAITTVNVAKDSLRATVDRLSDNWGADVIFECSGSAQAAAGILDPLAPGGRIVFVGMPPDPVLYDITLANVKEARVEHVFRYAHVYPRVLNLMESGKIDVKPLITDTFSFADSIVAFDFACHMPPTSVKVQIVVDHPTE